MSTVPAQRKLSESNAPEHDYIETSGPGISPNERATKEKKIHKPDNKKELKEADEYANLGYSYPTWKKWGILTVMFLIQISINLNASLYASGVDNISEKFEISKQAARVPQLTFLVAYAFGCELWAPWSEELGRWPTQQLSLLLVNIWQIPCALAPNYGTLVVCRLLGGLSTAGGSVTLGVLADMWEPDDQEYAIAFLVLSSVGGSVVGAVVGGFVETLQPLPWIFWTQLIAGGAVQIMHFVLVPETRSTIILDRLAKKRRKAGEEVYGPNEVKTQRMTFKEVMVVWSRPFYMLITEPIVAWLSAVSGFSDNLIFIFLQGFQPVYKQWVILLEPIGLIGFAWTSLGPSYGVHWIGPMFFSMLVGIANYSIYQSSIDYTVAAYGVYAASATGGNDFARDFLSGIAAIYSGPMYENIGERPLEYASTILAIIALFVTVPVFYFYKHGPEIRMRSKFASEIAKAREQGRGGRPKNEGEKAALPGHEQA
ncbi:major facilitator superfamily transporter [Seiridium cupressi]